ncbi:1-acyl-sn-glycerol-3-phosphate acyltransferase [Candidatus Chlorohelix allophototropha]|uniref:1-acyl-sn-glycerol-3-phosphate acyltransferase n=1 Tax=Candidatus Chlorohelix allophototropha TaxID=3003348 RepID=A0ABY9B909_9CHLR|nr:1-acyl-sn-glycerol-3-phosphate acyltransferase [Chloroflexota bacterium L227-S17]
MWQRIKYPAQKISHQLLYYFNWLLKFLVVFVVSDCTVIGRENMPRQKTGVLVTINHMSMWDLPFAQNIMPRPYFTMTKIEFLNLPFIGGLVRLMGAYPVRRGKPDRQALQFSTELLKKGELVLLYPEGHRSDDYQLIEGHSGAALIAISSEALVVPVAVTGTEFIVRKRRGIFSRPKVVVRIGKPYHLSRITPDGRKASLEELTDQMMSKIAELMPPEYQGYYTPAKVVERQAQYQREALEERARRANSRNIKSPVEKYEG